MNERVLHNGRLDRLAMAISGICLIHCLATAIILGFLAGAAGFLGAPIIHEAGLAIAMTLGIVALGRGAKNHGYVLPSAVGATGLAIMGSAFFMHEGLQEAGVTIVGVLVLALGHQLNRIASE